MTATDSPWTSAADPCPGLAVHCTQGALGEWFTVIPRSVERARDLQRSGVVAGASLSSTGVRQALARLGVPGNAIDTAIAQARRAATTISVPPSAGAFLPRLFF